MAAVIASGDSQLQAHQLKPEAVKLDFDRWYKIINTRLGAYRLSAGQKHMKDDIRDLEALWNGCSEAERTYLNKDSLVSIESIEKKSRPSTILRMLQQSRSANPQLSACSL